MMASYLDTDTANIDYDESGASHSRPERTSSDENPACQSCRKKKSKCSRQQPCSQCVKSGIECVYDDKRLKGGIKTGVVERLHQRMDAIENMFLGQAIFLQKLMDQPANGHTRSFPPLPCPGAGGDHPSNLRSYTEALKGTFSSLAGSVQRDIQHHRLEAAIPNPPLKRKRDYETGQGIQSTATTMETTPTTKTTGDPCALRPLPNGIEDVMEVYFRYIHPWVPVLHPSKFVKRAHDSSRSDGVTMILRAMVAVTARHMRNQDTEATTLIQYATECRQRAIAEAIQSNTIEALQALILVAFDTIRSGLSSSPWSIVGSICRKVEDLQLNSEKSSPKDSYAGFFVMTTPSLEAPSTWLEIEERRRVFWAAFLMDRFCSIVASTNPSISSKNIRRRLPCDGYIWESDLRVETSFFKTQDPPQSNDTATISGQVPLASFPPPHSINEGPDGIGGLAYTVEATESLSLITKFNMRHPLALENAYQISSWLNRFRQLDSRLLQWELCLSYRWQDARVVDGYIDPNLTLAHMTHNTAIIVLHQRLAYPPVQSCAWLSGLVQAASREACTMAAMKITKLARRYLDVSDGIPPHQFAFCLFVAGQVLLAQAAYYAVRPPDEVGSIIAALDEVSQRVSGYRQNHTPQDPASKFAKSLAQRRECRLNGLSMNETAKSQQPQQQQQQQQQQVAQVDFCQVSNSSIRGEFQHCVSSPSSGPSPGLSGMAAVTRQEESSTNDPLGGDPLALTAGGLDTRDFYFEAELRRLESRAKEYDRMLK